MMNSRIKEIAEQLKNSKDVFWNLCAFAIYIGSQQLVIMPVIAKQFSAETYAWTAIFLTIFNIVVCVIGDELANTYLIKRSEYKKENISGDFLPIFIFLAGILAALGVLLNVFFWHLDGPTLLCCIIILILGGARYFLFGYLKGNLRFFVIFCANLLYALCACLSLAFLSGSGSFLMPFLCGEIPAALFLALACVRICPQEMVWRRSPKFLQTVRDYVKLSFSALLIEGSTHLDRLLVYPRLGEEAMSIYYSSTTMTKLTSMVTNPISGVILARLSNKDRDGGAPVLKAALIAWPILAGVFFILNLVLAPLALKLLYSQFFEAAIKLIVPVSAAGAFGGANYLIKPVLLKFYSSSVFVIINLIYAGLFLAFLCFLPLRWGMMGFAAATVAARLAQSACYLFVLMRRNKHSAGIGK